MSWATARGEWFAWWCVSDDFERVATFCSERQCVFGEHVDDLSISTTSFCAPCWTTSRIRLPRCATSWSRRAANKIKRWLRFRLEEYSLRPGNAGAKKRRRTSELARDSEVVREVVSPHAVRHKKFFQSVLCLLGASDDGPAVRADGDGDGVVGASGGATLRVFTVTLARTTAGLVLARVLVLHHADEHRGLALAEDPRQDSR